MISAHVSNLAGQRSFGYVKGALVGAVFAMASGCHNYTAEPLCDDSNSEMPPNIAGTYTITTQGEDFKTQTKEITIGEGDKGFSFNSDDPDDKGRVCKINGKYYSESYDEGAKAYSSLRVYSNDLGIVMLPIFYDKDELLDAGIAVKVFTMPENLRSIVGTEFSERLESFAARFADDNETKGLLVVNKDHPATKIAAHAKEGPAAFVLLRK